MTYKLNKNGGRDRIVDATYSPKLFRRRFDFSESYANDESNLPKLIWIIGILAGIFFIVFYFGREKGSPVALPDNGGEIRYEYSKWMSESLAPFKIISDSKKPTIHHWLMVSDWNTSEPVLSIFVMGGREAQTLLPLGEYRVQVSEGSVWYGAKYLFGRKTIQNEIKVPIKLTRSSGNQLVGVSLALNAQTAQSREGLPSSKP